MPALNPKLRSIAATWPYCVYAVLALLLVALFPAFGCGGTAADESGGGTRGFAVGAHAPSGGVVITADADDHEEVALAAAAPEGSDDAATVTAADAVLAVAHDVGLAPAAGESLPRSVPARRQLPRGPPPAVV